MTPALLHCPFCGNTSAKLAPHKQVRCENCGATGPTAWTDDEAAARWNRRASYATHLPGVMAETEGVELARPLVMAVGEERSCFTCRHDWTAGTPAFHYCKHGDIDFVDDYTRDSGAHAAPDGMPTNRTLACPGWAPKENP